MGATQFCLLFTLGLRANHFLLDLGCGSLRAGRLFIIYLDQGRYFGIEPNKWLIEDAVKNQIGEDSVRIKEPRFHYNQDFATNVFSERFDFILAQAVFSFCGRDMIRTGLQNLKESLKPNGMIAATFAEGSEDFDGLGNAWVYPNPKYAQYRPSTIRRFAQEVGLFIRRIPWYHPRQTWYVLTGNRERLPTQRMLHHLRGAVLFDPDFAESWQ